MKALVFNGPNSISVEERRKPTVIEPTDAVVRVRKTTICGTDLHILRGHVPTCLPGTILGHEGVGVVESIGAAVSSFKPGDRVLISCVSSCGKCESCRNGMYSHCETGGWILGHKIDGTQAEFVRIPHAETSLYHVPQRASEEAIVMLSDILPTGFECAVLAGKVAPGSTVAIVGAGPVGLAAVLTAQFYSPSRTILIDLAWDRLNVGKTFGATDVINSGTQDPTGEVMRITDGRGVDTAVEAVGIPETFLLCQRVVAAGGTIANVGVHGSKVDLHLETLWGRNITITTGLVDTRTTPQLIKMVKCGKLDPGLLISHRFDFSRILNAYQTFRNAAAGAAIKIVISI